MVDIRSEAAVHSTSRSQARRRSAASRQSTNPKSSGFFSLTARSPTRKTQAQCVSLTAEPDRSPRGSVVMGTGSDRPCRFGRHAGRYGHRRHRAASMTQAAVTDRARHQPTPADGLPGPNDEQRSVGGLGDQRRSGIVGAEAQRPPGIRVEDSQKPSMHFRRSCEIEARGQVPEPPPTAPPLD